MLYKILIILLILFIFYSIININIETFATKQYTNTNIYPWERNNIISSIPYDIILKNNKNTYYDYGNDELDEKFNKVFNLNNEKIIKTIEGIEWNDKWLNPTNNKYQLDNYFNKFMIYFNLIIRNDFFDLPNDENNKFYIKNQMLKRYKYNIDNQDTLLLDIEMILYRNNKPLARHIKVLVISNGIYNNVIMAKVIGVINECNLNNNYDTLDDKNYQEFKPEFKYKYDMNSFIYDTNEKLVHSEIEYNLYNKILKEI
jgi:hypothetical protein